MERIMIGSVESATTQGGKPIVELFSTDTRLQYPVLRLFDLSALADVGIDPNDLPSNRYQIRFWAHYEISEKTSGSGQPYKDVVMLEPLDAPATTTSTDTSAILQELRQHGELLAAIADQMGIQFTDEKKQSDPDPAAVIVETLTGEPPPADPQTGEIQNGKPAVLRYKDGIAVDMDNADEVQYYKGYVAAEGKQPPDRAFLRTWVLDTPKQPPTDDGFD